MQELVHNVLFILMSALTILGGVLFVTNKNIVRSILFFLVSLLGIAGLFLLLNAPFVALTQILVYGGAITVLILFVVMLTIANMPEMVIVRTNRLLAAATAGLLFLVLAFIVGNAQITVGRESVDEVTTAKTFGNVMFQDYLMPFEIAAVLLLAALVAAIYLAISGQMGEDKQDTGEAGV